ncbi:hypothetical protein [Azospirillum melinis]
MAADALTLRRNRPAEGPVHAGHAAKGCFLTNKRNNASVLQ